MPAKGGQKKSAQKCSHAGEKLKVQAQCKDKHVLMTSHRKNSGGHTGDAALVGLSLILTPWETDPARTCKDEYYDKSSQSAPRNLW